MGITKEQAIAERERRRNLSSGASSHSSVTKEQAIAERERRRSLASQEPHRETSIGEDIWSGIKNVPGQGWGAVGRDIGNRAAEFAGDIGHMFMHPIESAKQTYGMGKEINAGISQLEHARGKKNLFAGLEQFGRGVLNTPSNIVDYGHKFGVIPDWIQAWKPNEDVQNFDYAKHLGIEGEEAGDKFTRGLGEQLPYLAAGEIGLLARAPAAGRFARTLQTVRNVAQRSGAQAAHAVGKNEDAVKAALMYPAGELGLRAIGALGRTALNKVKGATNTTIDTVKGLSSKNIAKKVMDSSAAATDAYNKKYGDFFDTAKKSGVEKVKIPQFKSKSLIKAAETKEANAIRKFLKDPTIENAHRAQSDLGKLYRSLKKTKKTRTLNSDESSALRSALKSQALIKNSIKESLGENLSKEYTKINKGYKKEVVPYNNRVIHEYLDEGYTDPDFVKALNSNKRARKHIVPLHPEIKINQAIPKALKGLGYGGAGALGIMKLKDLFGSHSE